MTTKTILFGLLYTSLALGQGSLLLVGGGSDGPGGWADEAFAWFVNKADSGIIIDIDAESGPGYANQFIDLGAAPASETMIISTRTMANDSVTYKKLITAKGIFMHGGDQHYYVDAWKGTLVEDAIHFIFQNGGTIGGTSAGLAILGEVSNYGRYSITAKELASNPYHRDLEFTEDFLNILPNVITDSHFHSRGRLGRLVPMIARRIHDHGEANLMGIGVSDKTALCIDENRMATTVGEASVTIIFATDDSKIRCEANKPVKFTNIHFDQLIPQSVYDLNNRTLTDPGPYLNLLDTPQLSPIYQDTIIQGNDANAIELGEHKITNLTTAELNAWNGRLRESSALALIPNSIIIPQIYDGSTYDENRWVGGIWMTVKHPHFTTIYLDNICAANINDQGVLTPNNYIFILDTFGATHAGVNGTRSTNHCGVIGARLHFLGNDDKYNLKEHKTVTAISSSAKNEFMLKDTMSIYPNPFNASFSIAYSIQNVGSVHFNIYNALGQKTASISRSELLPGEYTLKINTLKWASGIYYIEMVSENYKQIKKCVMIK